MCGARALNRHAAMMDRMARTLGIDLTDEMARDRLSGTDWREALMRCTGCPEPAECLQWLAMQEEAQGNGQPRATATPDYCMNRLFMAALRGESDTPAVAE